MVSPDPLKSYQNISVAASGQSNHVKFSLENFKDLYNPNNNTINLSKLSMALKLETPLKDANGPQEYSRGRFSTIVDD